MQLKMLDLELQTTVVASAGWEHDIEPETIGVERLEKVKKELFELESWRGKIYLHEKGRLRQELEAWRKETGIRQKRRLNESLIFKEIILRQL